MKRKTVFLVSLFLANVFISCNNKELNERTNVPEIGTGTKVISESELIQGIETINNKYVNRSQKIRKLDNMNLTAVTTNFPLDIATLYAGDVASADADGAAVGARIGRLVGGRKGEAIGSLIGGVGASLLEAMFNSDESTMSNTPDLSNGNSIWSILTN